MTLVLHWQQWYFILGMALNFVVIPLKRTLVEKVLSTIFAVASLYVLYSSGFFTGGMQ
jgi:hypothetical protein